MLRKLIQTNSDAATTAVRLTLGAVLLPHALQKLFGWFGGAGISGTMGFMTGGLHLPAPVAVLAIVLEAAAALGLLFGALSRAAALGAIAIMLGAILTVHLHNGFFMNWFGAQAGEGYEYHLLVIAMALLVLIRGGGALSLDLAVSRRAGRVSG